jgi:hypothetical protein
VTFYYRSVDFQDRKQCLEDSTSHVIPESSIESQLLIVVEVARLWKNNLNLMSTTSLRCATKFRTCIIESSECEYIIFTHIQNVSILAPLSPELYSGATLA